MAMELILYRFIARQEEMVTMSILAFLATLIVAIFGWQAPAEAFKVEYPYVTYERGDNPTKICCGLS